MVEMLLELFGAASIPETVWQGRHFIMK